MQGKLTLGGILLVLFLLSLGAFQDYYTTYPLQILVGCLMASVMYLPTVIALWYFDRREREPWQLAAFAVFSVIFFFGMVTSQVLGSIDKYFSVVWVVGFVEDFWKVVPLLFLVFFIPRAVNGWRDGLVYGAFGGLGFAILEFAGNTTYEYFPEMGWSAFQNGISRFNILGTHNHIIWSAAIGAAIGWAITAPRDWKRYAVPLATYLGIAVLHVFEDKGGNIMTTMIGGAMLEPWIASLPNPQQFMEAYFIPFQMFFGTINLLIINIVPLFFLWRALKRSGDVERQIISEQLAGEVGSAVTSEEYKGVKNDHRYKTRHIPGLPKSTENKIVQLQNELAFQKDFVARNGGDAGTDPVITAIRHLIEAERATKVSP